MKYKVVKLN